MGSARPGSGRDEPMMLRLGRVAGQGAVRAVVVDEVVEVGEEDHFITLGSLARQKSVDRPLSALYPGGTSEKGGGNCPGLLIPIRLSS